MKKTYYFPHLWKGYKKTLLIMKLIIALNLMFVMSSMAGVYSQSSINLNMSDVTVKDVIKSIENSSDYRFFYNAELSEISRKVDVDFIDQDITQVLEILFNDSGISYKIFQNNLIVIAPETVIQQMKVTGRVTDAATGETLPGVNIIVEGTSNGAVTDNSGRYSIEVPSDKAVLIFSYIGYNAERIDVAGQTVIDVVLVPNVQSLEEVVVIGYGTAKKSDLAGSVASVTSNNFESQPVTNLSSALQGRAAGVAVQNVSGAPGGDIRIRIRGANSFSGGNDPLFVVDGIQLQSFRLNDVNPADIASMEILKDASATAIYGSRGANGVVLITTRKGQSEKPKIDLTMNYGIANRSYKYDLLDPVSYAEQVNLIVPTEKEYDINAVRAQGGTDWQDEIFRTGQTKDVQLSVSGTTSRSTYYISGRYLDQTGIVINSKYKRYSIHSNLESKINDKITLGTGIFLNRNEGFNNLGTGVIRGGVGQALIWGPAEPLYDPDGQYNLGDPLGALGKNPVANLMGAHAKNIQNTAMLNTKITYKIFDFLTLDIIAGMDASLTEGSEVVGPYDAFRTLGANRRFDNSLGIMNSNILTFHKVLADKHDVTVTGVFEQSKSKWDYASASGSNSPFSEGLQYYNLGAQPDRILASSYSASSLRSYLGRVNYTFNEKYILTASFRADGSSKFPNHRWGYFPSFGLGWRLSEEGFIKDLNLFSNLKLRGGWGVTGNPGVSPYATISTMRSSLMSYGTGTGTSWEISNNSGNSELKWEETSQTDFGIDMGFFRNRLSITADYYNKQTKDLLLPVPKPLYWGGGNRIENVGSVENKGIELSVSATPIQKNNLTWTSSIHFFANRNKVLEFDGSVKFINSTIESATGNGIVQNTFLRAEVGKSMAVFYGNVFQGIYQEDEAEEAAVFGYHPGDSKYLDVANDLNPDGSTKYAIDSRDWVVIGDAMPKYSWSFDNTVSYKNLELNVFIQSIQGNDIFNMDYAQAATAIGESKTITLAEVTPWTSGNGQNKWPLLGSSSNKDYIHSTKWLQDGSFIRLKNVSLAYRFPNSIIKGAPLLIRVSGQNLLTLTKYEGYDPEAASAGTSDRNMGVVVGAYPNARTITFSLQLNF